MKEKKALLLGEISPLIQSTLVGAGYATTSDVSDQTPSIIVSRGPHIIDANFLKSREINHIFLAQIGSDNVDLTYCKQNKIGVSNVPTASVESTAEHAFALFLSGIKNIGKANTELKAALWDRNSNITHTFAGKKIGVAGFGKIGKAVAKLYSSVGMQIYAYDMFIDREHCKQHGYHVADTLEELAGKSDYLSVHLPLTPDTKSIINASIIAELKGIANASRGTIVDEQDILAALQSGSLDFYATDVFADEPNPDATLLSHPRVVATPHIAANSVEAQQLIAENVVMQLQQYFNLQPIDFSL